MKKDLKTCLTEVENFNSIIQLGLKKDAMTTSYDLDKIKSTLEKIKEIIPSSDSAVLQVTGIIDRFDEINPSEDGFPETISSAEFKKLGKDLSNLINLINRSK